VRPLVWFRADLRVRDNPALYYASRAASKGVIAVFTICPEQWKLHDWGAPKVNFTLRNLIELSGALEKLNIPLRLITTSTFGNVPAELLHFAERHGCDTLYFNEEYELNEARRDRQVRALFEEHNRQVHVFADQTVFTPGSITKDNGSAYTVFAAFRKKWWNTYNATGAPAPLLLPRTQSALALQPARIPMRLRAFAKFDRPDLWPAGERRAAERLRQFISRRVGNYHELRDFPAANATSSLSPYLASGVLSVRHCLQAALCPDEGQRDRGRPGITAWVTELIWREFYRSILAAFPRVSMHRPFRLETEAVRWQADEAQFEAWREGRTGIPIVDAGMRQLHETGWMHNRVRMIVASFLTKDLLIDWRWGERHFMQYLVDADLANNNGGWQWSASTGTDAAPYFRIFNPFTQGQRFDPDGSYVRRFVPELAKLTDERVHRPRDERSGTTARLDYPLPIVNHAAARRRVLGVFARLRRTTK
jgi:deoxyribodipyrimidine photo-lyase